MIYRTLAIVLAISFWAESPVYSQKMDTVVLSKRNDSIQVPRVENKWKFFVGFDARRSFVLEKNSKFNGVKLGLSYRNKHRFGLGFYGMDTPIRYVGEVDKNKHPDATDTVRFNFGYVSTFYEYVWYKSKRWDLSTPIHLGIGNLSFSYLDTTSKYQPFYSGGVLMSEFTGVAQFKVFRWFAIGSGAGYRMMLIGEKTIRKSLNSPIFIFQFKILFGEIYKMTFRRKNLEKW